MRRTMNVLAAGALCALTALAMGQAGSRVAGLEVESDDLVLSAEEVSWLDAGFSKAERTLLDSTRGFAPPAFGEEITWKHADPLSWDGLRGKVVVVQSWTHTSADGRGMPRKVDRMLQRFSKDSVQVINLHTPEGAADFDAFADRAPEGAVVAVDSTGAFCDELGIYKEPVTLVIDRQGVVRYTGLSLSGLVPAVTKLVNEPFNAEQTELPKLPSRSDRDLAIAPDANQIIPPTQWGFPVFPEGSVRGATELIGKAGPALTPADWCNGQPNTSGKLVMVEFWATWCGPCKKNIPHLNVLADRYRDSMVIVGVSDEKVSIVKNFLKTREFKYTIVADPDKKIVEVVDPEGIPYAILMSPDGIVRWQGYPGHLSESLLNSIVSASGLEPPKVTVEESADGSLELLPRWVQAQK